MTLTLDQTQGCVLGLALGDAQGAPYEGGFLERAVWKVIGRTRRDQRRWTDDTQMSIDILESFLAMGRIDPDDLASRFAQGYRWSRGYGPAAARVLKRISAGMDWREANRSVYPNGSFGNGAAMRAPMIGLAYFHRPADLVAAATDAAVVTHAHPLAIEGAVLVAVATASALRGDRTRAVLELARSVAAQSEFSSRLAIAQTWLDSGLAVSPRDVAQQLGNGIPAHESSVTALFLALRFREESFESLHRFVAACGGDADTIGAMAGALWGAMNGLSRLPSSMIEQLEQSERLLALGASLYHQVVQAGRDLAAS